MYGHQLFLYGTVLVNLSYPILSLFRMKNKIIEVV